MLCVGVENYLLQILNYLFIFIDELQHGLSLLTLIHLLQIEIMPVLLIYELVCGIQLKQIHEWFMDESNNKILMKTYFSIKRKQNIEKEFIIYE